MHRRVKYALILLIITISGCAPGPFEDSSWPAPRPLGRDLEAVRLYQLPDGTMISSTIQEPKGTLSLRQAIAAALLGSPDLAATSYEVRAREAEALQAGLIPNPKLEVELENFAGSGEFSDFDTLETTLALSQVVELGGKRIKRQRIAEYEARIAGWEYEIRRIDVLSKTAADYVSLLAAHRQQRIAFETLELAQRVFDAVDERVDAGKVSPLERIKAGVELAQSQLDREQALLAVVAARIRLASNWGSTNPSFENLSGDLDKTDSPPTFDKVVARVVQNPDLARWAAEASLRQAEVKLALALRIPDITVTGGLRRFNELDETAFVAGFSLPLPVFDQNQGNIRAARLRAIQGGRLEEAARVQIHTAIAEAFQILEAAFISVQTTRNQILPSAVLAFEATEEAFRQGKIGSLDLFDSERTLFDVRRQLTESLTTYHLAVIALERLIGAPLHEIDQNRRSEQ